MQVPREVLREWAIVQAEGSLTGVVLPAGMAPTTVQTFSLQARTKSSPTPLEHMAVQQACHQLLSNVIDYNLSIVVLAETMQAWSISKQVAFELKQSLITHWQ